MTDSEAQAAQIVTFLLGGGGFVTFCKWAFTQWMNDRKEDRAERVRDRESQLQARELDRNSVHTALFEIHLSLAAMLERDRIRDERRKRETQQPHAHGARHVPRNEFPAPEDETTNVTVIKDRLRAEATRRPTPAIGVRTPRPGTHHDRSDHGED